MSKPISSKRSFPHLVRMELQRRPAANLEIRRHSGPTRNSMADWTRTLTREGASLAAFREARDLWARFRHGRTNAAADALARAVAAVGDLSLTPCRCSTEGVLFRVHPSNDHDRTLCHVFCTSKGGDPGEEGLGYLQSGKCLWLDDTDVLWVLTEARARR